VGTDMLSPRDIDIIKERIAVAKVCKCNNCICCDTSKEWVLTCDQLEYNITPKKDKLNVN
jgi:hypothetical protein